MNIVSKMSSPARHDSMGASLAPVTSTSDKVGKVTGYAVAQKSRVTSGLPHAKTDSGYWHRLVQKEYGSLKTRLISTANLVGGLLVLNLPTVHCYEADGREAHGCEWGVSGTRNATLATFPALGAASPIGGWAKTASDVVLYGGVGVLLCSHLAKFGARLFAEVRSSKPERREIDTGKTIKIAPLFRIEFSDSVKSLIMTAAVIGVVEFMKDKIDKERPYVLDRNYINGMMCMEPDDFNGLPSGHTAVSAFVWQELINNGVDIMALLSPDFKHMLSKTVPIFSNMPLSSPAGKQAFSLLTAFGFGALAGTLRIMAAKHDLPDVVAGMVIGILASVCSPKIRSGVANSASVVNQKTGYYYNEDVYCHAEEDSLPTTGTTTGKRVELVRVGESAEENEATLISSMI